LPEELHAFFIIIIHPLYVVSLRGAKRSIGAIEIIRQEKPLEVRTQCFIRIAKDQNVVDAICRLLPDSESLERVENQSRASPALRQIATEDVVIEACSRYGTGSNYCWHVRCG
jgi:hypothetical protein